LQINKFYQGNALDVLKTFPEKSIDMSVTSPPYWALRNYQSEDTVWDCDCEHEHEWSDEIIDKKYGHARSGTTGNQKNDVMKGSEKKGRFCSKCHCEHEWNEPIEKKMTGGTKSKKVQIKGKDNFQKWESQSNFCSKCPAWKGQLGLEPTFDLYIKHLCDIFDETKRVLKDEATLWVNIGDTYDKNKSLTGIPFRFAIEMINRGWILRNTLIWHKNNCMPTSVKDRFTVDFEYIFFFTKQQTYYFEQQFEKSLQKFTTGYTPIKNPKTEKGKLRAENKGQYRSNSKETGGVGRINPKGRNKRTVWKIPTKPFKEAHFAVFPEALIETPILAGCKEKGIVLDMFSGAGTTALVAKKNNRNHIGIELNQEYIKIAEKRLQSCL
jgi:DNA modification methylase